MSYRIRIVAAFALLLCSAGILLPTGYTGALSARASSLRGGLPAACFTDSVAYCPNGATCGGQPCNTSYACPPFVAWYQTRLAYASATQTSNNGNLGVTQYTAVPCEVEVNCAGCTPPGTFDYGYCTQGTVTTVYHNYRIPTLVDPKSAACNGGG